MATARVNVNPELLRWACERAGRLGGRLREKFPWLEGTDRPTLKQLEAFARAARVSVGYLFLPSPPVEEVPIPDLRTVGGQGVRRPSPDLLDLIQLCQRRQDWYREYAEQVGEEQKPFCGSATLDSPAAGVAADMLRTIEFGVQDRVGAHNTADAMRLFIEKVEAAGVLVMVSGIVGTNTRRKLDPDEFRGFTLYDPVAPLVFVNSVDTEPAQMFTLAHELAHVWLGQSALSDADLPRQAVNKVEKWCNEVAAEFLIPLDEIRKIKAPDPIASLRAYTSRFKVSNLVVLRRLLDAQLITKEQFSTGYTLLSQAYRRKPPDEKGGGDFYNTFPRSASRRFIRALYADTLRGNTPYRDALQLLGISKAEALRELGRRLSTS